MIVMAKKPPKPVDNRARKTGLTRVITIEVSMQLEEVLQAFCKTDRRTRRAIIEISLEEFFTKRNLWPPPPPDPPTD